MSQNWSGRYRECVHSLFLITASKIPHQREAGGGKKSGVTVVSKTAVRVSRAFLPSMHVPLPVVGHPAVRAAAGHRVRHAGLGGAREQDSLGISLTIPGPARQSSQEDRKTDSISFNGYILFLVPPVSTFSRPRPPQPRTRR